MSADMHGRTVLVTGANSGIGLETAAGIAKLGARVVLTARDPSKGEDAMSVIRGRMPDADLALMNLDLSRLTSVRAFAREFLASYDALHVLVNNAGAMFKTRRTTEDGFEMTFQVNHLSPFLLTNLLLDRIKGSAPARIVNVASVSHRGNKIDFDDLQSEGGFRGMRAYGQSKLCNILFTRELARRLEGTGVTVNALHPGAVRTGITKDSGFMAFGMKIAAPLFLSAAKGADTSVYLASSPEVEGRTAEYWVKRTALAPSREAQDDEVARRLWHVSAKLVGLAN